jgi:TRAP-type mannitol/chloroaromatic compound transport system substrate-binding protein
MHPLIDRETIMTKTYTTRRQAMQKLAAVGAATLAAPHVAGAQAGGTTWKIQTSWPGGVGLQIFKDWCATIEEKTGGELAFQPFGANDVVGDFQLYDAVKTVCLRR